MVATGSLHGWANERLEEAMKAVRDRIRRGLLECVGIPAFLGLVALAFLALCKLLTGGA